MNGETIRLDELTEEQVRAGLKGALAQHAPVDRGMRTPAMCTSPACGKWPCSTVLAIRRAVTSSVP